MTLINKTMDIKSILGAAPLAVSSPRSVADISVVSAIPKNARPTDAEKLAKVYDLATKGLTFKFALIEPQLIANRRMEQVYDIGLRIYELNQSIMLHDMQDVFFILTEDDLRALSSAADETLRGDAILSPINLFESFGKVSVISVRASNKFYAQFGQSYTLQNLHWSEQKVLNSLDPKLSAKVQERLRDIPVDERGGPLVLKLALDFIIDVGEEGLHSLNESIRTLKLTDFPGENVSKAASFLRGTLMVLKNCDAAPPNHTLFTLLFSFFKTASTKDFSDYISTLQTNQREGLSKMTLEDLLTKADRYYDSLYRLNKWVAAKKDPESVFYVRKKTDENGDSSDLSKVVCFKCKALGHYANKCPLKNGPKEGHGGKPLPVPTFDRKPPGKDQPHERVSSSGQKEFWCGHCSVWCSHKKGDTSCPKYKPPSGAANLVDGGSNAGTSNVTTNAGSGATPTVGLVTPVSRLARTGI